MLHLQRLYLLTLAAGLFAAPPARIVSTTPGITEILFDLGLGPRVVGVSDYCRYPESVRKLPKVGSFLEPDLERIAALRPDLVLTIRNPVRLTERLREFSLNAVEVDPESKAGALAAIETIGRATGIEEQARQRVAALRAELAQIRSQASGKTRRTVLFLVGRTPGTLDGLIGAGRRTYLDELLEIAGGQNVLADSPVPYPKVSLEVVAARNPEVLIDMGDAGHADGAASEPPAQVVRRWAERMPKLRAVREHRVYSVADDVFVVPGPRMAEAARAFQKMLQGDSR